MKLATIDNGSRDGQLVVVSTDLARMTPATAVAPTLQAALENWDGAAPQLRDLAGTLAGGGGQPFDPAKALAPLPRAYQWLDGSVFRNHLRLMATAFKRDLEKEANYPKPLMYQGGSDSFLGARQDVVLPREEDGIDFEAEIGIIVSDVPMGTKASDAGRYIRLVVLINDVSLRRLAPIEMDTGFGWLQAKPSSAFSLTAVTPDELGAAWKDGRLERPIRVAWNGKPFGAPSGREMTFNFHQLIEQAAYSRTLSAGTVIGSGTVSNEAYKEVGSACIAERRAIELIEQGEPKTAFMRFGDRVQIDMTDDAGHSIFGGIDQCVRPSR
ncbi:fumarylacetoacetate hydrolase family protein [Bradyrhizobium sp. RDT10]